MEQFGAALRVALAGGRAPLSRLGDWLAMAAHLTWLRSRLLLPEDGREGEEARREAGALRRRLADREHARRLADWLERRPRLGCDVFARGGAVEEPGAGGQAVPRADIVALLRACLAVLEKGSGSGVYRPAPLPLWRVPDVRARLRRLRPTAPLEGAPLERFLPEAMDDGPKAALRHRAALASTLLAGLELEREGATALAQGEPFAAIRLRPRGDRRMERRD